MLSKLIVTALALAVGVSAQTYDDLNFHVFSDTSSNGRSLKLRPNQYDIELGYPPDTYEYVGVDNSSAVLYADYALGGLYSETNGTIGHRGYLNVRETWSVGNTTQYLFIFGKTTTLPNAIDSEWYLVETGDGTYGLYHKEPEGLSQSFVLCEADWDLDEPGLPWYALTYVTFTGEHAEFDLDCEFVGIRTSIRS